MSINDFVNTSLLAEPYNWLLVILVLVGAVMVLTMIQAPLGQIGGLVQAV